LTPSSSSSPPLLANLLGCSSTQQSLDTSLIINLISQQFKIWVLFDLFVIHSKATTSKAKVKQASKQESLSNGKFLAAGFQIFFFCCLLLLLCSDILLFKPIELEFSLWFVHSDGTHFEYFVTVFFWLLLGWWN
jgi:hypothetical protein